MNICHAFEEKVEADVITALRLSNSDLGYTHVCSPFEKGELFCIYRMLVTMG